jgi:hypothetical protein
MADGRSVKVNAYTPESIAVFGDSLIYILSTHIYIHKVCIKNSLFYQGEVVGGLLI